MIIHCHGMLLFKNMYPYWFRSYMGDRAYKIKPKRTQKVTKITFFKVPKTPTRRQNLKNIIT
jgi:hypothetical protein